MAFRWRADDCPFIAVFGSSIPSLKNKIIIKKISNLDPLWQNFPCMEGQISPCNGHQWFGILNKRKKVHLAFPHNIQFYQELQASSFVNPPRINILCFLWKMKLAAGLVITCEILRLITCVKSNFKHSWADCTDAQSGLSLLAARIWGHGLAQIFALC